MLDWLRRHRHWLDPERHEYVYGAIAVILYAAWLAWGFWYTVGHY